MSSHAHRRGKITEEHAEEARKLFAIWEATYAARKEQGVHTQEAFGERFEIGNQAAVGFFLHGKTALSLKAARGFAKGLGVDIATFSPRLAAEAAKIAEFAPADSEDFIDVKRVDVRVSAGNGAVGQLEEVIGNLKFSRSFLRNCGVSPSSARVVDVHGTSMEPTIKDGAVLLVSTSNREPVENQIFALTRPSEGLVVKRLVRAANGHWIARSDNREFPDITIDDGEPISIIGRAVWMGAKL